MTGSIGIRREDKSRWERRVPLTPKHVASLVAAGTEVVIQPSQIRIFPDADYSAAGAVVREDLSGCNIVIGVKEMPVDIFRPSGAHMFFSHTIKGQAYNMPMLRDLMAKRCHVLDYEKITDGDGRRLVAFGHFAGLAGMIDTLWTLGARWREAGVATPFADVSLAFDYDSLDAAKVALTDVGERMQRDGLPTGVAPLVIGVAGYGGVSKGVQEILATLPRVEMSPADLLAGKAATETHRVVQVVFEEKDTVVPRDAGATFDLQHFFSNPGLYQSRFADYVPHLTVLVNCIYWSPESPRLITLDEARTLYGQADPPKLEVIGDISCDIGGGIELTRQSTDQDAPVFVYDPLRDAVDFGVSGRGPAIMAVDNLPCELARDSSEAFGAALLPFMPALATADFEVDLEALALPPELKRALILHRGALTPDFDYMEAFASTEVSS